MPQAIVEDILYHDAPALRLQSPDGASAIILLHGAHVVSWIPAGGQERLYMSELAQIAPGKAVRGGIPVIFPQFSTQGPLPRHGFTRTQAWEKQSVRAEADYAMVTLRLAANESTRAVWPHAFALELSVSVTGNRFDVELEVLNEGDEAFAFTCALHTYLRVKEVEEAHLEGLNGHRYTDCTDAERAQRTDTGVFLAVEAETDRIYHQVERPLLLRESRQSIGINAENMPDVVVWNPWEHSIKSFTDMPPKDFRRMLCVEAAAIETPVTVAAGESWWGRQTLIAM